MLAGQSIEFIYGIMIGYSAFCSVPVSTVGSKMMCNDLKNINLTSNTLIYTDVGSQGVSFANLLECKELEVIIGDTILKEYF